MADTAGLEPVRFAQGKLCTRVTRTVLARRCDADSAHISTTRCARGDSNSHAQRRRCLGPLWLPVSPLAQIWCADRDSNPDARARRSQRRLYASSSIGTNFSQAQSCRTAPNWSARRDSNPHRACARCVLSAVRVPVPPRAEIWRTAAELNLRDARLKGALQAAQSPFPFRPQTGGLSRI